MHRVCMCTHSRPVTVLCVCFSANSPSEEGDPVSEGRAGHVNGRTEGRAADCGGDPEVCPLSPLGSAKLLF